MAKKEYGKPLMFAEQFVPQTYVAACGTTSSYVTYEFQCDAGKGTTYNVYLDYNHNGEYDDTDDRYGYIGNFYACNEAHSVTVPAGQPIDDVFPTGFIGRWEWTGPFSREYRTYPVRIWRGDDGNNIHCTFQLHESQFVVKNPPS